VTPPDDRQADSGGGAGRRTDRRTGVPTRRRFLALGGGRAPPRALAGCSAEPTDGEDGDGENGTAGDDSADGPGSSDGDDGDGDDEGDPTLTVATYSSFIDARRR